MFKNKMTLSHVAQKENVPKTKKCGDKVGLAFKKIDEEIKREDIGFSMEEAIEDNLYD